MHSSKLNIYLHSLLLGLLLLGTSVQAQEEGTPEFKNDFVSLGKPMVLNLSSNRGRLHFLQIQADILVRSQQAKETAEIFVPLFRHILIVNLSEQDSVIIKNTERREQIRSEVTRQMIDKLGQLADASGIEEILFSEFLVQ